MAAASASGQLFMSNGGASKTSGGHCDWWVVACPGCGIENWRVKDFRRLDFDISTSIRVRASSLSASLSERSSPSQSQCHGGCQCRCQRHHRLWHLKEAVLVREDGISAQTSWAQQARTSMSRGSSWLCALHKAPSLSPASPKRPPDPSSREPSWSEGRPLHQRFLRMVARRKLVRE